MRGAAIALAGLLAACSAEGGGSAPGGAGGAPAGLAGGAGTSGGSSNAGAPNPGGGTPNGGGAASTGGSGVGGVSSAGGAANAGGGPNTGGAPVGPLPATCSEAAAPFAIAGTLLDAALVPYVGSSGFGSRRATVPVAVSAAGQTYVGFTREEGGGFTAVVAAVGGAAWSVPNAMNGGLTATSDGVGVLLLDAKADQGERLWAGVARLRGDGTVAFQTDLFRSPNLDDPDTKGEPGSGRIGFIAPSDELVAYFGHTERSSDGVRHQGGYLATIDGAGTQTVGSGWFGSHNLDQRLLVDGSQAAVLGLGDAYPEGIFFSFLGDRPRPEVLFDLAAAGNGAANGQLGGMVDLGDEIVIPFITNRSIPQDLSAGVWPDIDDAISQQIRDAAANGTDMGLLRVPKTGTNPGGELVPTWFDPSRTDGTRLERLKAVRYGAGGLILLTWAESTGSSRQTTSQYFTMVIDRAGAICQPKTPLATELASSTSDDAVRRPDGTIVWANVSGTQIQLVVVTPG